MVLLPHHLLGQVPVSLIDHGPHVRSQEQSLRDSAQPAGRRFELHDAGHPASTFEGFEYMLVMESVKRPPDLLVDEPARSVERGYPNRKPPRDPEMPCTPGDLVAQAERVGCKTPDRLLV